MFEALARDLPVPLVCMRPDGTLMYTNREAAQLTGYPIAAMLGRPFWLEVTYSEDRHRLTSALRAAARDGHAETSVRFQTKDSAMHRIDVHLRRIGGGDEICGVIVDVTEQDEVAAALFQSEMLYQTFLEQSPIGIAHLDAEGIVTFENHRLRTVTGEDAAAAWIGRTLNEIGHLDERVHPLSARMLAEGTSFAEDEFVIVRSDGSRRYAQIHGAAIRHPENGIIGGVLMLFDVTEEYEREEELRVLQRYDIAGLALRDAAFASNHHTFLGEAARILGATALAERVLVVLPDEGADGYIERARWACDPEDTTAPLRLDTEAWNALSQGDTNAVQPNAVAELAGGKDVVVLPFATEDEQAGMLLLVSAREESECWVPAERRALRRLGVLFETLWGWMLAEARYRQVVSSVEDSLFSFAFTEDGERCYSFATQQMETLTGYSTEELLAGDLSWSREVVYAEDREAVAQHDHLLRNGHESRLVYRIRTAQGGIRWLRESATPGRDRSSLAVVAGTLSDVTEAKEAETSLIQAKQDAESATRMKSTFLATMSHEIRTPLGAISGFAELLLEEVEAMDYSPPEVTEFASTIRTSTKKVLRLVNDLFDLASLQSGRIYVDRAPVALHPIITQVALGHAKTLAEHGVDLAVDLAVSDPIVLGEARRIEQVAEHLLSNAVKFTEEGRVRIATGVREGTVHITVEDSGIGIAPDYIEDLFEPFSQEDHRLNRNYEGSGLGLAIVKRLVEAMNGTITVESRKGEGTRFEVTLPRADD